MAASSEEKPMNGTKRKRGEEDHKNAHEATTHGDNEWKKRAPYSIHDTDNDFKVIYEGHCHCGTVKYQLSRDAPLKSKTCHCTTCQVQHAAPFQWAAIFQKEDINFTHGHHDLEWYDPSTKKTEHHLPCKVRCAVCHSPIMDEGRKMILLFPTLIKFKSKQDRDKFAPKCHMFYGERCMDVPDGLPKWSGLDEKSELIEDSPREAIEEFEQKKKEEKEKEKKENKEEKEDSKDDGEGDKKDSKDGEEEDGAKSKKRKSDNDKNGSASDANEKQNGEKQENETGYDLRDR